MSRKSKQEHDESLEEKIFRKSKVTECSPDKNLKNGGYSKNIINIQGEIKTINTGIEGMKYEKREIK